MGTFYLSAWDSFGPWFHASRKRAEEERNWLGGAGRGWEGLGGAGRGWRQSPARAGAVRPQAGSSASLESLAQSV